MSYYRPNLSQAIVLVIAVSAMVSLLSSCGDTSKPDPESTTLTEFALTDINPYSASTGSQVALDATNEKIIILFCGETHCNVCMSQVQQIQSMAASLNTGKTIEVAGLMMNHASDTPDMGQLFSYGITIPVLQDTLMTVGGVPTSTIKHINDIQSRDLIIVQPSLGKYHSTTLGRESEQIYDMDLETTADSTTVANWINEILQGN